MRSEATKERARRYYQENREAVLAQQKKRREENPEHVRAIVRKSFKKNPQRYNEKSDPTGRRYLVRVLSQARGRAEKQEVPFTLTMNELAVLMSSDRCPACYCEFAPRGEGRSDLNRSVDRVIPKLGYTEKNCVVLCMRCNRIKNDASANDLRRLADFIDKIVPSDF